MKDDFEEWGKSLDVEYGNELTNRNTGVTCILYFKFELGNSGGAVRPACLREFE